MSVELSMKAAPFIRSRSFKAHLLGFLGANLAIGAISLWALPLLLDLAKGASDRWSPERLLAPWSAGTELTPLAVLGDILVLVAIGVGIGLLARAARLLGDARLN